MHIEGLAVAGFRRTKRGSTNGTSGMNEREFAVSFSMGGWTVMCKYVDGKTYSSAPMPSLEAALRDVENQTGGPVLLKLVTRC